MASVFDRSMQIELWNYICYKNQFVLQPQYCYIMSDIKEIEDRKKIDINFYFVLWLGGYSRQQEGDKGQRDQGAEAT
jgi:hypothetical protein